MEPFDGYEQGLSTQWFTHHPFVFAVCLELVLFHVFIIYFSGFLRVDHVIHCAIQGLEGFDDHLFGYLCPCFLDPPEDKISAWRLLLPSWGKLKWPRCHPCEVFWHTLSLNGLFRHSSKGCTTAVRPPGITATSMFRCFRSSFTESAK